MHEAESAGSLCNAARMWKVRGINVSNAARLNETEVTEYSGGFNPI